MKYLFCFLLIINAFYCTAKPLEGAVFTYKADDPHIKYIGQVDFSDPLAPKFTVPGVYVEAKFKGTSIAIDLNDENLYGTTHNYLEIAIDNNPPFRIQTTGKTSHIVLADHLPPGVHTVIICKDTEAFIGYVALTGITCEKLLPVSAPKRKIEFIGDSITAGNGSDESTVKCGQGNWYDQHNAYMAYGPTTARALNAQWQLTAISGIGLIHSCCNMQALIPQAFDNEFIAKDSVKHDYIPDLVTICIGQNDGIQDSTAFCTAYVNFIKDIRTHYPKADIVCLTSPMANTDLRIILKKYLLSIEKYENNMGDNKVSHYFFSRGFNDGCGGHPSMAQHQIIAAELTNYLRQLKNW